MQLNKSKKSYSLTRKADLLLHGPRVSTYALRGCHTDKNMKFSCAKILNYNTFDMAAIACSTFCTVAVKKVCGQLMSSTPVTTICCENVGAAICMASTFGPLFCKQNIVLQQMIVY